MDPRGNIYSDDPENIPPEDKARLDGYLRGRAEADEMERLKFDLAAKEAALEAAVRGGEGGDEDG